MSDNKWLEDDSKGYHDPNHCPPLPPETLVVELSDQSGMFRDCLPESCGWKMYPSRPCLHQVWLTSITSDEAGRWALFSFSLLKKVCRTASTTNQPATMSVAIYYG